MLAETRTAVPNARSDRANLASLRRLHHPVIELDSLIVAVALQDDLHAIAEALDRDSHAEEVRCALALWIRAHVALDRADTHKGWCIRLVARSWTSILSLPIVTEGIIPSPTDYLQEGSESTYLPGQLAARSPLDHSGPTQPRIVITPLSMSKTPKNSALSVSATRASTSSQPANQAEDAGLPFSTGFAERGSPTVLASQPAAKTIPKPICVCCMAFA